MRPRASLVALWPPAALLAVALLIRLGAAARSTALAEEASGMDPIEAGASVAKRRREAALEQKRPAVSAGSGFARRASEVRMGLPPDVLVRSEAELRSVYELLRSDNMFFEEFMSHNPWVPLRKSEGQLLPMIGDVRFMFSMEGDHLGFFSQQGADPPVEWFKELRPAKLNRENVWAQPLPPGESGYSGYVAGLRNLLGTGAFYQYSLLHDPHEFHTRNQLEKMFRQVGVDGVPIYVLFKIISYDSLCDLVLWRFLHMARNEAVDVFLTSEERFNSACLEDLSEEYSRAEARERLQMAEKSPPSQPRPSQVNEVLRGLKRPRRGSRGSST